MNGGWAEKLKEQQQQQQQLQLDQDLYAEVGDPTGNGNNNKSGLSTFAGSQLMMRTSDPAPYATTTLAMQNQTRRMVKISIFVDLESYFNPCFV